MFSGDLEDVLTEQEIRALLYREIGGGGNDLELDGVLGDFTNMKLTTESFAGVDAVQELAAQPVSMLRKWLIEATEEATGHPPYP